MLIKDVAASLGPRVKVVTEEYGNSPMAERFGVRRYPVVFVDDVLVARPKDFGFAGPEDKTPGRYVPWRDPANQQRFSADLRRMIERRLKGEAVEGLNVDDVRGGADEEGPPTLPARTVKTLSGRTLSPDELRGKIVLVEIWATWCPPCRSTLTWLDQLQRKHGDRLAVIALAVDSPEADVRRMISELSPSYAVAIANAEVIEPFGTVAAVPKMFLFDGSGKRVRVFYGAPRDHHEKVAAALGALGLR